MHKKLSQHKNLMSYENFRFTSSSFNEIIRYFVHLGGIIGPQKLLKSGFLRVLGANTHPLNEKQIIFFIKLENVPL